MWLTDGGVKTHSLIELTRNYEMIISYFSHVLDTFKIWAKPHPIYLGRYKLI